MGLANDLATDTTIKKDANKNSKNSSCSIIPKTLQGSFKGALANNYSNNPSADRKFAVIKAA